MEKDLFKAIDLWIESDTTKTFPEIYSGNLTWDRIELAVRYLTAHKDYDGEWMLKDFFNV